MLHLFRKFQRVLFIIVTIIIAISFTFFGTGNRAPQENKIKRIVVAKAIDDSQIYLDEIREISHFLNSGYQNPLFIDLMLENGLARRIAEGYFKDLENDLASRLEKAKRISLYEHFAYPEFSARNVWKLFHPELLEHLDALMDEKQVTMKTFDLFVSLYSDQAKFSPDLLKRILIQNLRQIPNAEDPKLIYQDLSLFGFTSTSSWFGENFLNLVSQAILNVSKRAQQEGYVASNEQVKQDFLQTFRSDASQAQEAADRLQHNEAHIVKVWGHIYLFKTYIQDLGNSILYDKQMFKDLSLFDKQKAKIVCYSLPRYFEMESFQNLLKLQTYLSATTASKEALDFSSGYLPVSSISKDFPQLVEKTFHVRVKKISKKELEAEIPLKKMWQWQSEQKNWKLLCEKFTFLDRSCEKQERFSFLQKLSSYQRKSVDQFSREKIISQDPVDIRSQLLKCEAFDKKFTLRKKQQSEDLARDELKILEGIEDCEKLYQFLDSLSLNQEEIYTDNQNYYSSFIVTDKTDESLLLFEKASSALDEILKEKYEVLKEKHPAFFQDEKGQFKPIGKAASQICKLEFAKLWEAYKKSKASTIGEFLNDLKQTRLMQARLSLIENLDESQWATSTPGILEDQWKLIKEERTVEKADLSDQELSKQVFLTNDEWPSIDKASSYFFHVLEKTSELDEKKIQDYKKDMSRQFVFLAFTKLLDEMKEKEAIVLLGDHDR